MDFFPEVLTRLKHALRVSKDQEVAQALDLSKTAFSERKKRGAFPEKELRALAAKRPELGIDVDYVLTGKYKAAQGPSAEQFGAWLRMERVRLAFDEEEFADVAGISLAQYRAIEAGQAEADNAIKAALYQVEKIDPSFLMTGTRIAPAAFELQGQEHRILHVYRASPEVRAAIDATVALGEDLLKAKHKAG